MAQAPSGPGLFHPSEDCFSGKGAGLMHSEPSVAHTVFVGDREITLGGRSRAGEIAGPDREDQIGGSL